MNVIDDMQKDVQVVLDSMRTFVEATSDLKWSMKDGFLLVVRRAILVRQFDTLEVISNLVRKNKSYAAGPLLRPACEELIWLKYLSKLPDTDAEELVILTANNEMLRSLRAQDEYGGRMVSESLGLVLHLENAVRREEETRHKLQKLGEKLGWPKQYVKQGRLPSMHWLAEKTNEKAMYDFLYHATSRFVHFSVPELLRRAWGNPQTGNISVRSVHFRDYWGMFSLHWGLRLFLDSAIIFCDDSNLPDVSLDEAHLLEAAERIGKYGQVPIITAEELAWPD